MNLRNVANGVTKTINANFPATLLISLPPTVVKFVPQPTYHQNGVLAQVQPLSSRDSRLLDALNIQGAEKAIYINGPMLAISRIKKFGGDLIVFPDGTLPEGNTWLVMAQLELWGSGLWSKCGVILQDDIIIPAGTTLTTDLSGPGNEVIVPAVLTGV